MLTTPPQAPRHGIPGFRTGQPWKKAVALVVYIITGLFILAAISARTPSMALFGALILALFIVAANGWGVRSRIPLVRSSNPIAACGGWVLLLLGSFVLMLVVTTNEPKRPTQVAAPITAPLAAATATTNPAPNIDATVQALAQVAVQATLEARSAAQAPEPTAAPTTPPTAVPATAVPPTAIPSTAAPVVAPPTSVPPRPTSAAATLIVVKSGLKGTQLRASPETDEVLKTVNDYDEMIFLDERKAADGALWDQVRDEDGQEGWMLAQFLTTKQAAGMATAAAAKPAPAPTSSGPDLGAITSCEHHVKPRLKAPSTAKYSGWFDSVTQTNANGTVTVFAYVDAQNSFGAMIRTQYVCTVGPSAGANERRLVSLTGL